MQQYTNRKWLSLSGDLVFVSIFLCVERPPCLLLFLLLFFIIIIQACQRHSRASLSLPLAPSIRAGKLLLSMRALGLQA